jgi:hypothetical protein
MSKTVKFEGKTYSVPDDATMDEIQALIDGPSPPGQSAEPKPMSAFDTIRNAVMNPVENLGNVAIGAAKGTENMIHAGGEILRNLPAVGHLFSSLPSMSYQRPEPPKGMAQKIGATLPLIAAGGSSLPAQTAMGALAGGAADIEAGGSGTTGAVVGGALPYVVNKVPTVFDKLRTLIPSKASAGAKLQQIRGVAKDVPLNTSPAEQIAQESKELAATGASNPAKPVRDFIKNRAPVKAKFAGQRVAMSPDPMTYETGFDFASNAGRVSAEEGLKLSPNQARKLAQFTHAMKAANREAAASVGMGDLYDQAMKEYARASNMEEAAKVLKKWTSGILGKAALGATAYGLYEALRD